MYATNENEFPKPSVLTGKNNTINQDYQSYYHPKYVCEMSHH